MNDADLQKLDQAVARLLRQAAFARIVERLREELARTAEPFVWASVALENLGGELPVAIKSCWIFHLRRDVPSGCHYHPNSVQHMVVVSGRGRSNVGGREGTLIPFATAGGGPAERWCVIAQNEPHEFVPEGEDMTVVSFHTCAAEELEEVACDSGATRTYEGRDPPR